MRQYDRSFSIGGRLSATILLIGFINDAKNIEKLFDMAAAEAEKSYARLNPENADGDLAKAVAKAGQGASPVASDVLAAFQVALQAAGWSSGAFDIVQSPEGNWHDISVNKGSSSVEIKKAGMQLNFDPMINGFMAELLARYLATAGMQNLIVKVGNVFRGVGAGLNGPWKIQVQDDAGTFARHALNLTIINTAAATVSASQFRAGFFDPRSKKKVEPPCKGVVVLANDAGVAEALASAVFVLGPADGMKLLAKYGKGLIVDNEGKFLRSPGF